MSNRLIWLKLEILKWVEIEIRLDHDSFKNLLVAQMG